MDSYESAVVALTGGISDSLDCRFSFGSILLSLYVEGIFKGRG